MMNCRTLTDIVFDYLRENVVIKEVSENFPLILDLAEMIIEEGDSLAYQKLKSNCDAINDDIFESLSNIIFNNIQFSDSDLSDIDDNLLEDKSLKKEIEKLIKENRKIAMGICDGKTTTFNSNIFIEFLLDSCRIVSCYGGLKIYNHSEEIYNDLTEELLGKIVMHLLNSAKPNFWKSRYEKDIWEGLKRTAPVHILNQSELLVALNNGIFDLNTQQINPFTPDMLFTSKSSIRFDVNQNCPIFKKTISEICCDDSELIMVMQETFGNALIGNCKAERAFFWSGNGSNGKSLLSEILTEMVGRSNVSNIPLTKFSDTFGLTGMIDKSINISNENEIGGTFSTEALKSIVSGDPINISIKYESARDIKLITKLIFLTNNLPNTIDNTHGFYRKILLFPFNRTFSDQEADKNLKGKIMNEMSGVLNWAIEGAVRLIKNKYQFTYSNAIQKEMDKYKVEQNPVDSFFKDCLKYQEGESLSRKVILDKYKNWLLEQAIESNNTDSPQKFWKLLNIASKQKYGKELDEKKVKGIRMILNYEILN